MPKHEMSAVLVAVNAQYIHTGLSVRSIDAYVRRETDLPIDRLEFTINNAEPDVLATLYERSADVYLFSCYLWNIEFILRVLRNLRQLLPRALFGLGGPQVSYQAQAILAAEPAVDLVVIGEGEETVCQLLRLLSNGAPLQNCNGIAYRCGKGIVATPVRLPLDLDVLPFAYPDLDALQHRILYYESMRGCPFSCSYCSSSIEHGVRRRSLPLVFEDMSVFLEHRVVQVKFVDRTFNCDKAHAMAIWEWLAAHDNGVTNFHFELSGELLDEDMLYFLSSVRPQLFQFEIGVQSTHLPTLREIDRPADLPHLFAQTDRLLANSNIHVHLDLIAGLPLEGYERFQTSFNDVYAHRPHQLQLGFLKVLPGSKMERMAEDYGLLYSKNAPYEVLATRWLGYREIVLLHGVANMVNVYYNSFRFRHILEHLTTLFPDAFSFFLALWTYYQKATEGKPVSEMGYYSLLESFLRSQRIEITDRMQWLAKYDLLLHEKPRTLPAWVSVDLSSLYRVGIQRFFMRPGNIETYLPEYTGETSQRTERTAHLEVFPFHPDTGAEGAVAILFNYRRRSLAGVAQTTVLPLEQLLLPVTKALL